MNKKRVIVIILVLAVVMTSAAIYYFFQKNSNGIWVCVEGEWEARGEPKEAKPIFPCGQMAGAANSFEDCAQAGNPVMESYPRQCRSREGRVFTEYIGNEMQLADIIRIDEPRPNTAIASPLKIKGEARGTWYFEASFPVKLFDIDGNVLAIGIAQAQAEWMTEEFVPFELELNFNHPVSSMGTLELIKDNPSGLEENDAKLIIPVLFK